MDTAQESNRKIKIKLKEITAQLKSSDKSVADLRSALEAEKTVVGELRQSLEKEKSVSEEYKTQLAAVQAKYESIEASVQSSEFGQDVEDTIMPNASQNPGQEVGEYQLMIAET